MAQLHLRLGPGKHGGACKRSAVAMLVHQIQQLCTRIGDDGPEGDPGRRARLDAQPLAHREGRVEHDPGRVAERPLIRETQRCAHITAAADKARAVRFHFE